MSEILVSDPTCGGALDRGARNVVRTARAKRAPKLVLGTLNGNEGRRYKKYGR